MLDLSGLPKNINGFRTTHTCELCGFEPKTKNKYREKQDHLVMKHFKERIDKIFPHCRPYSCPANECQFTGKDKQALLRHYTGKHGILEKYLREALAEKGIHYAPHEGGKRRHSEVNGNSKSNKNPRLSLSPPGDIMPLSPDEVVTNNTSTNGFVTSIAKPITLPTRPNTEDLRKEVEAMMRSFQPVEQQQTTMVVQVNSNGQYVNGTSPTHNSNGTINGNLQPMPPQQQSNGLVHQQQMTSAPSLVTTSLPSIVLAAVANATAASVAAKAAENMQQQQNNNNNNNSNMLTNGSTASCITTTTNSISNVSVNLPTQPANVPTITVCSSANHTKMSNHQLHLGPSASSLPLPIEIIANGNDRNNISSAQQQDPQPETILSDIKSPPTSKSPVVENEDVMWSAGISNGIIVTTNGNGGPAVIVEAANSLPIAYIEGIDLASFAANATNIENATIDFDYLYPTQSVITTSGDVRERQLEFSML